MGNHALQLPVTRSCTERSNVRNWRKQEGQSTLGFERSTGQRNTFLRSGQRVEDPNKIPSEVRSTDNCYTDNLCVRMAGVTMPGMMTGVRLDCMKVGIEPMTIPKGHFHLDVLILLPWAVRSGLNV